MITSRWLEEPWNPHLDYRYSRSLHGSSRCLCEGRCREDWQLWRRDSNKCVDVQMCESRNLFVAPGAGQRKRAAILSL